MYNEKYAYNQDDKNFIGGIIKKDKFVEIQEQMQKQRTEIIEKHNNNVKEAFRKAAQGEVIDLTALMISKEKLIEGRQSFK